MQFPPPPYTHSVAPQWQCQNTRQVCAPWTSSKNFYDTIPAQTLKCLPHTIRFSSAWSFWNSLRGQKFSDDAAVHNNYQWLHGGGEKILVCGNANCCSRREEDCWQSWGQYLKLTKPWATLQSSVKISCLACKWHNMKNRMYCLLTAAYTLHSHLQFINMLTNYVLQFVLKTAK